MFWALPNAGGRERASGSPVAARGYPQYGTPTYPGPQKSPAAGHLVGCGACARTKRLPSYRTKPLRGGVGCLLSVTVRDHPTGWRYLHCPSGTTLYSVKLVEHWHSSAQTPLWGTMGLFNPLVLSRRSLS